MAHTFALFLIFLKGSLLSFGGFGPLPLLQQDLVDTRHWATVATMGAAIAVGRISPGPNGLFVTSLGYFVGGVPGAIAATVAVALPPLFVLVWEALYRRIAHAQAVHAVTRGVGLAVVGLMVAVGGSLAQQTITGPFALVVAVIAGLAVLFTKLDPLVILLVAAAAGIIMGIPVK